MYITDQQLVFVRKFWNFVKKLLIVVAIIVYIVVIISIKYQFIHVVDLSWGLYIPLALHKVLQSYSINLAGKNPEVTAYFRTRAAAAFFHLSPIFTLLVHFIITIFKIIKIILGNSFGKENPKNITKCITIRRCHLKTDMSCTNLKHYGSQSSIRDKVQIRLG
jgi:hypothetical protein